MERRDQARSLQGSLPDPSYYYLSEAESFIQASSFMRRGALVSNRERHELEGARYIPNTVEQDASTRTTVFRAEDLRDRGQAYQRSPGCGWRAIPLLQAQ